MTMDESLPYQPVHLPEIAPQRDAVAPDQNWPAVPSSSLRRSGEIASSLVNAARRLGVLEDRMVHQEAVVRVRLAIKKGDGDYDHHRIDRLNQRMIIKATRVKYCPKSSHIKKIK